MPWRRSRGSRSLRARRPPLSEDRTPTFAGIARDTGCGQRSGGQRAAIRNRIRVTAQLITATDGTHLWSERYDRELADVFAVQDEISAAISEALKVRLSPQSAAKPRYTPTLPAYEALLKAGISIGRSRPSPWNRPNCSMSRLSRSIPSSHWPMPSTRTISSVVQQLACRPCARLRQPCGPWRNGHWNWIRHSRTHTGRCVAGLEF